MIPGLVSVVIPVFNREGFLAEAIESALAQEGARPEILVVDDGSTDGTSAVASRYAGRIIPLRQENAGPPAARNRGIRAAQGEFLSFLDSDDLWPPRRTRHLQDCLAAHPEAGGAMGHLQYVSVEDSRSERFAEACRAAAPVLNYNLSASLFRANIFQTVGMFDESMRFSDDWDWFVRAREKGVRIEIVPEIALINRRHGENLSNQRETGNHYTLMMLKKALDRRRSEGKKP
jgi:glycosyltransferase involved in cell wall biosynthesis